MSTNIVILLENCFLIFNLRTYITDGKFGALMEVKIVNDGPVTVQIESPKLVTACNSKTERKEAVVTEQNMPNGD